MTLTHPSPNHNSRGTKEVRVIVLHADAARNERVCLSWLQSSVSRVSYHVLIGRDGAVYRCVSYDRRAWHAGKSEWHGEKDVNGVSIGLAFSNRNDGVEALTTAQIESMKAVIADIRRRYGPLPVTTHARIAPGRKTDPEFFRNENGQKYPIPGFDLADYA